MPKTLSRNATTVERMQQAFNDRDFDAMDACVAEDCVWTDQARGMTFKGRAQVRSEYAEAWANAFSDGRITDVRICDGDNTVVAQFVGRGTHDGQLGPLPATGKAVTMPFCEIYHFDASGKVIAGESYYDQLSMLQQLGVAE